MELKIQKNELTDVVDFLNKLKLSGKLSRARIKIIKLAQEALTEMQEDIKHIREETDVDAELRQEFHQVRQNDGDLSDERFKPLIAENKEFTELLSEEAILDVTKYKELINKLYKHLDNLDTELDGKDGYIHDLLLTAIEENHTDVTNQFQEVE